MDLDSVLKQIRTEYTPCDEDRKRVETAITATLLAGGVVGTVQLASTSVGFKGALAQGSFKLLPVWFKSAVGIGATVAAVGGGAYGVNAYRSRTDAHVVVTLPVQNTSAPLQSTHPAERVAVTSPSELDATPRVEPNIPLDFAAPPLAKAQPEPARVAPRQNVSRPVTNNVQLTSLGELQLIGEASRAIQEGRAADAQKALREHERRYAHTALGQERSGLALLARCASDDKAAPADAAKFLQKEPNSPLATRIKRECLE